MKIRISVYSIVCVIAFVGSASLAQSQVAKRGATIKGPAQTGPSVSGPQVSGPALKGPTLSSPTPPAPSALVQNPTSELQPITKVIAPQSAKPSPKRQPRAGKLPKVHSAAKAPIYNVLSSEANGSGEVSFKIDLGMPVARALTEKVKESGGLKFSEIGWSNLSLDHLPAGVILLPMGTAGSPEIPVLQVAIAIPYGAENLQASLSELRTVDIPNVNLLPSRIRINDSTEERRVTSKYSMATIAATAVEVLPTITFRSLHFVTLRIPLAAIQGAGRVRVDRSFTAKLSYRLPAGLSNSQSLAATTGRDADPMFRAAERRLVVNGNDLVRFQSSFHPSGKFDGGGSGIPNTALHIDSGSTFDRAVISWIDRNAPYVKFSITRTGLYRATSDDILGRTGAAGAIDVTRWNASAVRLFNHGHEVPVWIDTTASGHVAAIEFYGERFPGFTREYYNVATDTNAYWLTTSTKFTAPPLRYKLRAPTGTPPQTFTTGSITLHHERDNIYYGGDDVADQSSTGQRTEWISGERFVWQELDRPFQGDTSRLRDTFYIAKLPADTVGKVAVLSAFFRGISNDQTTHPNHAYRIFVNHRLIAEDTFNAYDSLIISRQIPMAFLNEGPNYFEFQSKGTLATIDRQYFDYYSITLESGLTPSTDTAIVNGQLSFTEQLPTSNSGIAVASQDQVRLYDLTDQVQLKPTQVAGGVTIFSDSIFGGTHSFVGSTHSALMAPDQIAAWNVAGADGWDILDTSVGADYIVLTHPLFSATAKKLEFYRKGLGIRTKTVTTEEVFNAFNFGTNEPWAIRQYLHYAYDFYPGTPPGFVTLLGDGSWDPKLNQNNSFIGQGARSTHLSYVPTYGNPVSDYIFTDFEGADKDSLSPRMMISRISVETPDQADAYLRKLIEYEATPPGEWNKRFTFIIGGDGPKTGFGQHTEFMAELDAYLHRKDNGAIAYAPMAITPITIEKAFYDRPVDFSLETDIQRLFQDGTSLVYFAGHGSTVITDVSFGSPSLYRNKGKYPSLITLSCRTGAFAEPDEVSLNEAFLRIVDGGAIQAFGTTGYGEINYDRYMSAVLWTMMDTLGTNGSDLVGGKINLTTCFTLSKLYTSIMSQILLPYGNPNSLNQYLILGDALTGFVLRPQPELAVQNSDLVFTNSLGVAKSQFSLQDSSFTVTAKVHDFGYSAQREVHVRIRDISPKRATPLDVILKLPRLDSSAFVSATFPIDTNAIGQHTISVFIDNDSLFAESNETDNIATANLLITGSTVTPIFPPEGARGFCDVSADSVHLLLLAPAIGTQSSASGTLEIDVDTTSQFTHPRSVSAIHVDHSPLEITIAKSNLPTAASHVLWIRTRFTPPSGVSGPWLSQSLSTDQSGPYEFSYSTPDQLATIALSGLQLNPNGALALPFGTQTRIRVTSHGSQDTDNTLGIGNPVSDLYLNEKIVAEIALAPQFDVVEFSADGASIEEINTFTAPHDADQAEQDSLARLFVPIIDSIPAGRRVAVFTNVTPYFQPYWIKNPEVRRVMHSLGARTGFDSTNYFGSYALLGIKGAKPNSAREGTGPYAGGGVTLFDTVVNFGVSGTARTPNTAVATSYGKLAWTGKVTGAGSEILFSVLGRERTTGVLDTIASYRASSAPNFDLSKIDSRNYDQLGVFVRFSRDSNATVSPELSGITLEYQPAPELDIEPNSFVATPSNVLEGLPVGTTYTVRNLTCIPVTNLLAEIERTYRGTTDTVGIHPGISLGAHASIRLLDTMQTTGLNSRVDLLAVVNPNELENEQFLFNNTQQASFTVGRDTIAPNIDVQFDGRHVYNCDYVSSRPKIVIGLADNSPLQLRDTASITGVLRNGNSPTTPIYLSQSQTNPYFSLQFVQLPSGSVQAELVANPQSNTSLAPGPWTLTAMAHDASGNADTIEVCFTVASANGLDHVLNVPNPFKDQTSFTYQLRTGGSSDVKVVIYTVAGRKIKTLTPDPGNRPHAGVNFISWDGRDESGNEVANGTYLYRVVLTGSNEDGSSASDAVTERAVKSK